MKSLKISKGSCVVGIPLMDNCCPVINAGCSFSVQNTSQNCSRCNHCIYCYTEVTAVSTCPASSSCTANITVCGPKLLQSWNFPAGTVKTVTVYSQDVGNPVDINTTNAILQRVDDVTNSGDVISLAYFHLIKVEDCNNDKVYYSEHTVSECGYGPISFGGCRTDGVYIPAGTYSAATFMSYLDNLGSSRVCASSLNISQDDLLPKCTDSGYFCKVSLCGIVCGWVINNYEISASMYLSAGNYLNGIFCGTNSACSNNYLYPKTWCCFPVTVHDGMFIW